MACLPSAWLVLTVVGALRDQMTAMGLVRVVAIVMMLPIGLSLYLVVVALARSLDHALGRTGVICRIGRTGQSRSRGFCGAWSPEYRSLLSPLGPKAAIEVVVSAYVASQRISSPLTARLQLPTEGNKS